jgi:hypothetical protein
MNNRLKIRTGRGWLHRLVRSLQSAVSLLHRFHQRLSPASKVCQRQSIFRDSAPQPEKFYA